MNAYDKGYQAFTDGMGIDSNPFENGSDDFFDWESGWVSAADDEERDA